MAQIYGFLKPGRMAVLILAASVSALSPSGDQGGETLADEPPGTTAQQSFFEWTRAPLVKKLHLTRRQNLMTSVAASGGGLFLPPSRPGCISVKCFMFQRKGNSRSAVLTS